MELVKIVTAGKALPSGVVTPFIPPVYSVDKSAFFVDKNVDNSKCKLALYNAGLVFFPY